MSSSTPSTAPTSDPSTPLNLRPIPRPLTSHLPPSRSAVPRELAYTFLPSQDGVDSNLLVLLHGLGDTHAPFAQLGKSLNLPQTAVLSVRAPMRIPLLEEESYMWMDSFDQFGNLLTRPNPTQSLNLLLSLLSHLTSTSTPTSPSWSPTQIHLFGFAQGGSLASELALRSPSPLGSLTIVSGPLLSFPTRAEPLPTPACVFYRPGEERQMELSAFKKAFRKVVEVRGKRGEGMLRGREEWEGIMRFWSEVLLRKGAWEREGEVYEVGR